MIVKSEPEERELDAHAMDRSDIWRLSSAGLLIDVTDDTESQSDGKIHLRSPDRTINQLWNRAAWPEILISSFSLSSTQLDSAREASTEKWKRREMF